ncbi:ATP-binding protein [candidate division KSB1 bacterium]|nr:ATP-binding protein [candidate division KSB1 bacterium]
MLAELKRYGLDWDRKVEAFFDIYFGEGMQIAWRPKESRVAFNENDFDLHDLVSRQRKDKEESLFYIPAQRVLTLRDGWPRPFTDYNPGDPFAVREFSEKLRLLMEQEFRLVSQLFPQSKRLKREFREALQKTVFTGFGLTVDKYHSQKRLVLGGQNTTLPYMVWSAGQREFVPLLLGFYWLLPPARGKRRASLEWVVIEELEMGLHPLAIEVTLLLVLDLLARGYKVCLSTHSAHVLEFVWALRVFQEYHVQPEALLDLFNTQKSPQMLKLSKDVFDKIAKVYYFEPETGQTRDISNLDPGSATAFEAGWGGLSEFSGRVADVVARAVANQPGKSPA